MRRPGHLSVDVVVKAAPEDVWRAVTDWSGQSDWIVATRVEPTVSGGQGLGGAFVAHTGLGRFVISDPMVVSEWTPPWRCVVEHQGDMVRGTGTFEVFALPQGGSRFVWSEDLVPPFGALGRLTWPVVGSVVALGAQLSLRRLRRSIEGASSSSSG